MKGMRKMINDLVKRAYLNSKNHGFWEEEKTLVK